MGRHDTVEINVGPYIEIFEIPEHIEFPVNEVHSNIMTVPIYYIYRYLKLHIYLVMREYQPN